MQKNIYENQENMHVQCNIHWSCANIQQKRPFFFTTVISKKKFDNCMKVYSPVINWQIQRFDSVLFTQHNITYSALNCISF